MRMNCQASYQLLNVLSSAVQMGDWWCQAPGHLYCFFFSSTLVAIFGRDEQAVGGYCFRIPVLFLSFFGSCITSIVERSVLLVVFQYKTTFAILRTIK